MSTRAAPRRAPARPARAHPVPVRGASRLLRGWAAAFLATVLAAGSHTVASLVDSGASHAGHDAGPAPILWILTLALAGPVCTALAGRRLSWWRLSAGVAASQVLFHWLYSATAGVGPGGGSGGIPGAEAALPADSPAMAAAHLLAAVVTVFALRRGEVLAGRVADLAVGLILRSPGARLARWIPVVPARRIPATHRWLGRRPLNVLLPSLRLRGPPTRPLLALAA